MKAGLVCPYSWDVPGGVQERIRDLAEALMESLMAAACVPRRRRRTPGLTSCPHPD
jgi:hypothetical protein